MDEDSTWALKVEADADSDDYTPEDEDDEETKLDESNAAVETTSVEAVNSSPKATPPSRERKTSLPLSKVLSTSQPNGHQSVLYYDQHPKQYIRDLVKLAQDVLNTDSDEIAQEITRQGVKRFMVIKVCARGLFSQFTLNYCTAASRLVILHICREETS